MRLTTIILGLGLSLNFLAMAAPDDRRRAGSAEIAFQYTGRVTVDFGKGTGTVVGYITQLNGIPANLSLFNGNPSESTALFTFRADITLQPLPPNGDLGNGNFAVIPALIQPGEFTIYYNPNPSRAWTDVDKFSSGIAIAKFLRSREQFALLGSIATNTASAALESSSTISLSGFSFNLGRVVPEGVTNITTVANLPLPGFQQPVQSFAFVGYALAIGK